jgi:glycosyltransferase involved in cell wall biosynthesis
MNKKNIAIISTHPIQYQVPLFKKLNSSKISVDVFYASRQNLSSTIKDLEFNMNFKWDIDLLNGYNKFFSLYQKNQIDSWKLSFKDLEQKLKKKKYDAILIFGWNNLLYWKSFFIAKKYKIPIILRVETNLKSQTSFIKSKIKFLILKILFKHIDFFLFIGKLNKKFYKYLNVPNKKLFSAPYFVDNDFFKKSVATKNLINKELNFNNKKICLFVGKFIKRKNPFEYLKLAKLFNTNSNIHFLMVGDGILKLDCINYIKDNQINNVTILGFKNQSELRKIYQISNLLILPSIYETWGLVVNEAMACGIPVITTKNSGASYDLIKNNVTGYLYNLGNITDLKKKVELVLNDQKNNLKMQNYIKKKVKHYSIENTIKSIHRIINKK